MCGVFVLSSLPPNRLPKATIPYTDKALHGVIYAAGGFLVARAAHNPFPALLIPILFGATDEWHQKSVPGRQSDTRDWIADCIGTLAGVSIYYWIRCRRPDAG